MSDMWENLRRRARAAENSIDVKLVSLNKLNVNAGADPKTVAGRQALFDGVSQEIEALLSKLTNINDEMNDVVGAQSSAGWSQNPAVQHTLRRHREILRDYGTEFKRARDNVQQQLHRESLLSSSSEPTCLNNRVKMSDMYMKENDHISSCDRLLDDQISIAISTKENLRQQSMSLRGITKKIDNLSKKYPLIGSVMHKIQYKKRKDTIILAGVISACLIFMLFYIMH